MSHDPVALEATALVQPAPTSARSLSELHPRLHSQLQQARGAGAGPPDLDRLLPLLSAYYHELDAERRGVVRSMQLIADEARCFGGGLAGVNAGHLQAVLDHIKDVVITVNADGTIRIFNPTGERVFGYSDAEVIGRSIVHLLPDLPLHGSVEQGLRAFAAQMAQDRRDLRPRELRARHKDGHLFAAELIASRVHIEQREVYVLCVRDTSERVR